MSCFSSPVFVSPMRLLVTSGAETVYLRLCYSHSNLVYYAWAPNRSAIKTQRTECIAKLFYNGVLKSFYVFLSLLKPPLKIDFKLPS